MYGSYTQLLRYQETGRVIRIAKYGRCSSDEQKKSGYTIGDQLSLMDDFAKDYELVSVGEYVDEGISATLEINKRKALAQMIEDAKAGKFDIIVFKCIDRFFRNVEEYYASQISRMAMHERYDKSLLERYMYWLDDDELKSVFEGFITFKLNYDAFISDENFELMETEIEEKCVAVVQNSSCYTENYDMHMDCIYNTPDGFFMYLCKESIIDTICKYVDEDPLMLACLIKAFKYSTPHTAAEYTGLAMCLDYEFELDIFDPPITDMSQSCHEDHDSKDSMVIYKNKGGSLMIA